MQTSTRNREPGPSFAARKGHLPQLSISDESHHVTEAIGHLYGDEDTDPRKGSPTSTYRSSYTSDRSSADAEEMMYTKRMSSQRKGIYEILANGRPLERKDPSPPRMQRTFSWDNGNGHAHSPTMDAAQRSPSITATSHFPLNDIDYESSPAAVAQELSNLQALRRMSMDVHAAGDPDLPAFNPAAMPNAPSHASSPDDSSRLFWVPARLHPELAPKEFKTFLESKQEQIKRRSGELTSFSTSPTSSRGSSLSISDSGSLQRKKSMLSRQINNGQGYQDGAERLERKKSLSEGSDPNLGDLESLVSGATQRPQSPDDNGDIILPSVPGSSLKRSTRTKYRRGGTIRKGDRSTFAERAKRSGIVADEPPPPVPALPDLPAIPNFSSSPDFGNLAETLKDPSDPRPPLSPPATNFSRPATRYSSPPTDASTGASTSSTFDSLFCDGNHTDRASTQSMPEPRSQRQQVSPVHNRIVPQIVETPPVDDEDEDRSTSPPSSSSVRHPERTSSRETTSTMNPTVRPVMSRSPPNSTVTTPKTQKSSVPPPNQNKQSLEQPSALPSYDTNTANLSFIPTLTVDKQAQDKKESKKSGWGWLLGKDDGKKEDEKSRTKLSKSSQSHDNTRLDVLQTSIDGSSKRRETIELDRDSLRLEEERKKESQRKLSANDKKEKESIFSSFFGGKKSKADKETKKNQRGLSPEPPYREQRPDIDYSWTRFTILEERAIYRMAHIKLANPRRPLYSQVLLSNFMYSYLAKVQQMHPQMNLPTSAKQQKKQKEQPQQPDEFTQYQRYQQQQALQQQQSQQPQQSQPEPQQVSQKQQYPPQQGYEGDSNTSQGYEQAVSRPTTRGSTKSSEAAYSSSYDTGYNPNRNGYYQHSQQDATTRNHDEQDMW